MTAKKWRLGKLIIRIWMTVGILFIFYLFYSYQSHGVDAHLLEADNRVSVSSTKDFYSFTPQCQFKDVLVFYPGAMVDPLAYVPLCRKIAENNIKVYIIRMPWRLASKGYKFIC